MDSPKPPLTHREAQCLLFVARGFSSDEIARELALSPHTINKHVEEAMRKLGPGRGRRAVARDYAASLAEPPEQLAGEPLGVAGAPPSGAEVAAIERAMADAGHQTIEVRDSGLHPYRIGASHGWWHLPFRRRGERSNELTSLQSLLWVPIGALLIAILLGVVLSNLETLSRLRRDGAAPSQDAGHRPH